MKEHQIVASLDERFLFRTDWDDNVDRVYRAITRIEGSGLDVFVHSRDKSMERRPPLAWVNEFLKEEA